MIFPLHARIFGHNTLYARVELKPVRDKQRYRRRNDNEPASHSYAKNKRFGFGIYFRQTAKNKAGCADYAKRYADGDAPCELFYKRFPFVAFYVEIIHRIYYPRIHEKRHADCEQRHHYHRSEQGETFVDYSHENYFYYRRKYEREPRAHKRYKLCSPLLRF